ncbi:MAG: hypothetical protein V5A39_06890 [Haloarculaceae archaeon]
MSARDRRYVLAGLLGVVVLLTAALLWKVLSTLFFAVTVAYILYPIRQFLVGFTGGVLSVGLVGLIAGPVVVALLVEAVSLLSAEDDTRQQKLT